MSCHLTKITRTVEPKDHQTPFPTNASGIQVALAEKIVKQEAESRDRRRTSPTSTLDLLDNETEAQILHETTMLDQEIVGTELETSPNRIRPSDTKAQILQEIAILDQEFTGTGSKRKREEEIGSKNEKGKKVDMGITKTGGSNTLDPGSSRRRTSEMEAQTLQEIEILDRELVGTGNRQNLLIYDTFYSSKIIVRFNGLSTLSNSIKRVLVVAPEQPQCRF